MPQSAPAAERDSAAPGPGWPRELLAVAIGAHPRGQAPRWAPPGCAGAFALLTLIVCFWGYNAWTLPLLVDNQHYFYIAQRAASGVPPHVSVFDPKPHASTLLSAAAMKAGRLVGLSDARSGRLFSVGVTAAAVAFAWLLGWRLSGSTLGGHLAALFMLSYGEFLYHGSMGFRPKVFLASFALACGWLVALRRPLLAGIAGGICFLCWQPGLVFLAAAGLAALLGPKPLRNAALVVAGGVIPVALYEAYFAMHGALGEQWFQMFAFPAKYMADRGGGFQGLWPSTLELWGTWYEWYGVYASPLAVAGGVLIGLAVLFRRPRAAWAWLRARPAWVFVISAGLVSLAFTFRNHQGGPDLFYNIPTIAVAGAACLVALRDALPRPALRGVGLFVCLVAAAWTAADAAYRTSVYREQIRKVVGGLTLDDQQALAEEVRRWKQAGHTVYVTGSTHLLGMIDAENHVKYGLLFIRMEDYLTREVQPFYLERDGELPDIVVFGRRPFQAFVDWLSTRYGAVPQSQLLPDFWKDRTQVCVIRGPRGTAAYQTIRNRDAAAP